MDGFKPSATSAPPPRGMSGGSCWPVTRCNDEPLYIVCIRRGEPAVFGRLDSRRTARPEIVGAAGAPAGKHLRGSGGGGGTGGARHGEHCPELRGFGPGYALV